MRTCPPSRPFSDPLPCDISSFPLFFFFFSRAGRNRLTLAIAFTRADGSNGSFSSSDSKQNQTPNPPSFSVLIYFFPFSFFYPKNFTHSNRRLVCLPVCVNYENQASPFSHRVSLFQKRSLSHAKTSLGIQAHLKTKEHNSTVFCDCF